MKKTVASRVKMFLWAGAIFYVMAMGLYYFPKEYPGMGFWETLYYTLRLFVFEYDAPRFPTYPNLISIHFVAPLITLSAVGTAVSFLLSVSPVLTTRWMHDHVVVCGVGRNGRLFCDTLLEKKIGVAGVDLGLEEGLEEFSQSRGIPVIRGDFTCRAALAKAGASHARSVIFASGNDLVNLEGALSLYEWINPDRGAFMLIWVQIADERLAETARYFVKTRGKVSIRFFDTYHMAASKMVDKYFSENGRKNIREIKILGFGKFGNDLLDVLIKGQKPHEAFTYTIVDKEDRTSQVASMAKRLGANGSVRFVQAAIQDMDLEYEKATAFFLATDDDLGNITAALSLARKLEASHVFVRMAHWPLSAVSERVGENRGIHFVNINHLVHQGIADMPGVFFAARKSDLKRIRQN